MKYDFETFIDRDPAIRGTGKYRIMKDSKGNKPPKGIVPLSVADMEFKTAPASLRPSRPRPTSACWDTTG